MNTLDPERVQEILALPNQPYRLKQTVQVTTITLAELLDTHLPSGQVIDFLNVDVELRDLEVLRSNNWSKYRPQVVLVECDRGESPVHQYLRVFGYQETARTLRTSIFQLPEN